MLALMPSVTDVNAPTGTVETTRTAETTDVTDDSDNTDVIGTTDVTETVVGPDGIRRPAWADRGEAVRRYFDTEWGTPVRTEQGLFELIVLFVFAGGLTWANVLQRREGLRAAFAGFDADAVAAFTDADVHDLVNDVRIIRNRRKCEAAITNARATCALRASDGLVDLVWRHVLDEIDSDGVDLTAIPRSDARSVRLAEAFADAGFVHLGPVASQSLLLAAGVIPVRRSEPAGAVARKADRGTDRRTVGV